MESPSPEGTSKRALILAEESSGGILSRSISSSGGYSAALSVPKFQLYTVIIISHEKRWRN
jgi:hypothetical protein